LAVAEALLALAPQLEIRFAGTRQGLEFLLVPRAGFRLHTLPASGFRGLKSAARLKFLVNFLAGLLCSIWLILRWRPAVVLGTGGYVSAPVLAAARLLRRRTALQEQNAVPGSTNRLLGRWADRIYLGFAEAAAYFPGRRCVTTGNPVRAAFDESVAEAMSQLPEAPHADGVEQSDLLRVLVFGGSRGARTLNQAACQAAASWLERPGLVLWLQTGPGARQDVEAAFADFPPSRVRIDTYLFDMPAALVWADLTVCRAGAMTLAELAVLGKPAILVPFPHATDDHQLKNARGWEAAGAAIMLQDADCDGPALANLVAQLEGDRQRLQAMGQAARRLGRPDAALQIAGDLLQLARLRPASTEQEGRDVP
jgi:UDP-N-acetylglucosamine--N-acetylmuramyl-(pentapeptide) pyrophosphoryl-undecaprenol N-acetylglucosamine transferase